jgi:hypothetical protein
MIEKYSFAKYCQILLSSLRFWLAKIFDNYTIYNHIENCPVWNFWKVYDSGDLRYLIDTNKLPKYYNKKRLQKSFEQLLDSNTYSDFAILKDYFNCQKALYLYLLDPSDKNLNDYNKEFFRYIREYDKYYKAYEINGNKYNRLLDLYKELHKEVEPFELVRIRMKIFNPEIIKGEKQNSWDIYKDIQYIKEALGYPVNIKEITMKEYYVALETIKERSNKAAENGRKM